MDWTSLYNVRSKNITASEIGVLLSEARGEGFISFAMGAPDADYFPVKEISECASQILTEKGHSLLQYGDGQGYLPLREKLSVIMQEKYAITQNPEDILITSGSMQSLELMGRLFLEKGDTVLVENPTFIDAMNSLMFNDANIVGIDGDQDGMDLALLEKELQSNTSIKMIYVIPDFQNPTGKCWSQKRRQDFINLVSRYNVIVLEDNPYGEINYSGKLNKSIKAYDKNQQVIFMGSLSKTFSPGIRIGWLGTTSEIVKKLVLVKERCDLHSSIPDHGIANEFMEKYSYNDHVASMCKIYEQRLNLLKDLIQEYLPTCQFHKPEGGFFVWLQLPEGIDCNEFIKVGLSQKVAAVPGTPFFAAKDDTSFIRLNFTGLKEDGIREGVKRLQQTLALLQKNA